MNKKYIQFYITALLNSLKYGIRLLNIVPNKILCFKGDVKTDSCLDNF
jgi:hypothetical protein